MCNAKRELDARPAFVVEGANLDDEAVATPSRVPLSQLDKSVVEITIMKIHAAYGTIESYSIIRLKNAFLFHVTLSVTSRSDKLPDFSRAILRHRVLEDKLNDENCGSNVRKHLLQNASLLGHLEQAGLLQDDTCFIEFGAGKGTF